MPTVTVQLAAPAKINLHLEVLGRRADGFHELETVFQTLELADLVRVSLTQPGDGVSLVCSDPSIPADGRNLAWRAAAAAQRACPGLGAIAIELTKHIPHGAGLGGGSSDAAAVLRALAILEPRIAGLDLPSLAVALGSDVPFFLLGGTAYATGRGERLDALVDARPQAVTVLMPDAHLATPAVFAALDATERGPREPRGVSWWKARLPQAWDAALTNRLCAAARRCSPACASLLDAVERAGVPYLLCGSGAACVAFAALEAPSGVRAIPTAFRPRSRLDRC